MLTTLADQIWTAIQRPSPSVTKEEINEIVVAWHRELLAQTMTCEPVASMSEEAKQHLLETNGHEKIASQHIVRFGDWAESVGLSYILSPRQDKLTPEHALIHQYYEGTPGVSPISVAGVEPTLLSDHDRVWAFLEGGSVSELMRRR